MDRLTTLTAFVQVVDNGGFSAAARRLSMSVTMVSNHIQSLEDRLGVRLLNRTTRKVSLTDVGKAYYDRCIQILNDLEEADQIANALQSTPKGRLTLYTSTHIVRFIAPVVNEYLARYPEMTVDLQIGERMIDLIDEGVDLAIRTLPPPDSSLIVRRLTTWRHILCCSPGYLDNHPAPQTPTDLAQHNCLRYSHYFYGDEWHFTAPNGKEVAQHISGNLVTNSAEALRRITSRWSSASSRSISTANISRRSCAASSTSWPNVSSPTATGCIRGGEYGCRRPPPRA